MSYINLIFGGNPDIYCELMNAFNMSLKELGHKTNVISLGKSYSNYILPGDFNIAVDAYCRMLPNRGKNNILLHLENNSRSDLDNWSKVLHISPIKICKKSIYFPFGYSKAYDYQHDVSNVKEDIDISFIGKVTSDGIRHDLIQSIRSRKYDITLFPRKWGENRDIAIARTKINLTIKSTPECVFEQVRANMILSKGKLLFAEENYKGGYGYMEKFLIPFNKNNFEELADRYIDDKARKEWCDYVRYETTTNHTFTKYVKEVVL